MTQTLEQMLSPGSNIFEQPIFSKVFDGMAKIIRDTSKNPGFEAPKNSVLYEILLSSLDGIVAFRNQVSEFKKSSGIPLSATIAKKLSMYIHREVFDQNPLFRDYLEKYGELDGSIVTEVPTYESFKSGYGGNQA